MINSSFFLSAFQNWISEEECFIVTKDPSFWDYKVVNMLAALTATYFATFVCLVTFHSIIPTNKEMLGEQIEMVFHSASNVCCEISHVTFL